MLTEEQKRAVETRGKVIVSASAGSGKTFVMIERLVALILDGTPVREVLAVTFTNKAAAQMRERLRSALLARLSQGADEKTRERLKQNLTDLPLADISTIHAFCARLVRTHFYAVGADPAFRIISPEDAEGRALSARALNEAFEREYETGSEDFKRLLSVYFRKKKDAHLRDIVLALVEKAREHADYRGILFEVGRTDDFNAVCDYLEQDLRDRLEEAAGIAESCAAYFQGIGAKQGAKVSGETVAAARALLQCKGLFSLREGAAQMPAISNSPPVTRAQGEELKQIKRLRAAAAAVKEAYKELKGYADEAIEHARYLDGQSRSAALSALALCYDEIYARLKREAGVLDYNDLEHLALAVLSNENVRREIVSRYRYIFVDEYQDVNPAQERILSLLSGEQVFLVGDGKQAIYGFRGSRSEYFYDKTRGENRYPHALELTANFRSAPAVLDAVNRVFAPLVEGYSPMHGDRYGEHAGEVLFHTVTEDEAPEEEETRGVYSVLGRLGEPEKNQLAEDVAQLVMHEIGTGWWDADAEAERTVTFGDIAVLTRKNTGDAARIASALAARNIPVSTSSKVNILDFFEARLLIDWLSYLDNAEQDIPMAAAMLSGVGGFTDADLAMIRLGTAGHFNFRDAARDYVKSKKDALAGKLQDFFALSERYRALCTVRTAAEMLYLLLAEGLEVQIAAKGDSATRLARVRRLLSEAEGVSVHAFLKRLVSSGNRIEYAEGGGENTVKVLTMHAAKGLEYPVVILAGLDAPFHGADTREEVMWTDVSAHEFGKGEGTLCLVAPRSFDAEKKLVYNTVLRRASEIAQDRASVLEERNLLYVAMTRAKWRLHLFVNAGEHAYAPARASRFSEFIDLSALEAAGYFAEKTERPLPALERKWLPQAGSEAKKDEILAVYQRPYAFDGSTRLPVKSSATELLREAHGEHAVSFTDSEEPHHVRGGSVEEGLAYHAFLEHVRFGRGAKEELSRMEEEGVLSKEQLSLIDAEKANMILALPCFRGIENKRIFREQQFLVALPAREIAALKTDAEDEIVFQGAIDLLVESEDGFEVIDYKYSGRTDEEIRSAYSAQIDLYRRAVARTLGVEFATVRARIVNIMQCREIVL